MTNLLQGKFHHTILCANDFLILNLDILSTMILQFFFLGLGFPLVIWVIVALAKNILSLASVAFPCMLILGTIFCLALVTVHASHTFILPGPFPILNSAQSSGLYLCLGVQTFNRLSHYSEAFCCLKPSHSFYCHLSGCMQQNDSLTGLYLYVKLDSIAIFLSLFGILITLGIPSHLLSLGKTKQVELAVWHNLDNAHLQLLDLYSCFVKDHSSNVHSFNVHSCFDSWLRPILSSDSLLP